MNQIREPDSHFDPPEDEPEEEVDEDFDPPGPDNEPFEDRDCTYWENLK